ncbi:MAG TPA: hypothetical protein VN831_16140 [Bradyrhizobium sp.]|nr:hypothetical protein [Bradyrhizobium sp.]
MQAKAKAAIILRITGPGDDDQELKRFRHYEEHRDEDSSVGHSGMVRQHQTRNLEIPGSMLRIAPE